MNHDMDHEVIEEPHPATRIIDPKSEEPGFFYRPENIRNILRVFYVVCAVLFALDFVFHRHAYLGFEGLWGFYGIYGFVACVLLVLIAKVMRLYLWREPGYYDDSVEKSDITSEGESR